MKSCLARFGGGLSEILFVRHLAYAQLTVSSQVVAVLAAPARSSNPIPTNIITQHPACLWLVLRINQIAVGGFREF